MKKSRILFNFVEVLFEIYKVIDMKKIIASVFAILVSTCVLYSQANNEEVPERLKYYKEKYEETFQAPFEVVWSSVKEALALYKSQVAQQKNSQDDEGLFKGVIRSDNYVFTEGKDTSYQVLQKYQYNMKYIPSGIWINGRINYKIILKEVETNVVKMTLTSEMSALESYVTEEYHFWKSNGILETEFIEKLKIVVANNNK